MLLGTLECFSGPLPGPRTSPSTSDVKSTAALALTPFMQAELNLPQPTVSNTPDAISPEMAARVPTWGQLRERFADLHPRLRHVGVDDSTCDWFAARSLAVAGAAAEGQKLPEARTVLRRGAPHSQRRALWCLALCLPQNVSRCSYMPLASVHELLCGFCTARFEPQACSCCTHGVLLPQPFWQAVVGTHA